MEQDFKILLLEDADLGAESVSFELSKAKIPVLVKKVQNRASFLQALEEFRPSLILTDCRLPSFDGLTAMALVQEICPEVPFIFVADILSAEPGEGWKTGAAQFGAEIHGILADLSAASLIVFLSPELRILDFNCHAQNLTGWQRSEVLGKDGLELLVPEEKRQLARAKLSEILAGKLVESLNLPLRSRDGSQWPFRLEMSLLRDDRDRPLGVLMVGHKMAALRLEPKDASSKPMKTPRTTWHSIGFC